MLVTSTRDPYALSVHHAAVSIPKIDAFSRNECTSVALFRSKARYEGVNSMEMWSAWLGLSLQGARLAWEAQNVIALRLMRLGLGGSRGQSEAQRMMSEKVAALVEAQASAAAAAMTGQNSHRIAKNVIGVYRKRVGRNRRRLARSR